MNLDWLNNATKKELATRAKTLGIAAYDSMRKEELIKAITKAIKKKKAAKEAAKAASPSKPAASKPTASKAKSAPSKPLSAPVAKPKPATSENGNGKHHQNGSHKPTTPPAPAPKPKPVSSPILPAPLNRPSIMSSTVTGHASPVIHKPILPGIPHGPSKPAVDPSKAKIVKDPVLGTTTNEVSPKSSRYLPATAAKDRLVVVVRDPYWLSVSWELSTQSIQRAEAALAQDWHGAKPILRLLDVSSQDTTSTAERIVKDVEIHGGTNHWYIDVQQPPRTYRVDIGYLSRRGTFHVLCRSNVINTPKAGSSEIVDAHWEDFDRKQADQLYSMSGGGPEMPRQDEKVLQEFLEEKLRRPLASPVIPIPSALTKEKKFFFNLHAELIIWGETAPGARVTFQGEPIRLRPDGTFAQRYQLPDGRQIFPAIAEAPDGSEERKIVLAVERNTKVLEPLTQKERELEEDD
jgi:hypothetical protein